jgi:sarcosine dehydrogenase
VFGSKLGWERPNWFAPEGMEPRDDYSMGRQNWFDAVGEEHKACARAAGLFDQSSLPSMSCPARVRSRRWTGFAPIT